MAEQAELTAEQFVTATYLLTVLNKDPKNKATFVGQSRVDANGWLKMVWEKEGKKYYTISNMMEDLTDWDTYPVEDETLRYFYEEFDLANDSSK